MLNHLSRRDVFVQLSLKFHTICDALASVILSEDETIQVFSLDLVLQLIRSDYLSCILRSDIPDFFIEALKTNSRIAYELVLDIINFIVTNEDMASCHYFILQLFGSGINSILLNLTSNDQTDDNSLLTLKLILSQSEAPWKIMERERQLELGEKLLDCVRKLINNTSNLEIILNITNRTIRCFDVVNEDVTTKIHHLVDLLTTKVRETININDEYEGVCESDVL
jgi:hypothetical protein